MEQSILNFWIIALCIALLVCVIYQSVKLKDLQNSSKKQEGDIAKLIWCAENPPAFHVGAKTKHGVCYKINLKEAEFISNSYHYEFRFKKGIETVIVHQGSLGLS